MNVGIVSAVRFLGLRAAASALPLLAAVACGGEDRRGVVRPDGGPEVVLMDFARPFPLDRLPAGWRHRTFWTREPMTMTFAVKDGVPAMRFETAGTASMLFRHVDIDVAQYPILVWRWFVETPIASLLDERTREGDDHPARLFLTFRSAAGSGGGVSEERRMEIVWGNRLKAGDYKYIGGFPHYVADGGDENVGHWRDEAVDLREVTRRIWPDSATARLVDIAVFCDSDETHGHTVAYVAEVRARRVAD